MKVVVDSTLRVREFGRRGGFHPNELRFYYQVAGYDCLVLRCDGRDLCGWNVRDFDLPVIHANLARFHDYPAADIDPIGRVVDLFDDIRQATGRWYKLDVVAAANLGRHKVAHGQQAAEWLRSGDPALIRRAVEYCRDDVTLVTALYDKLQHGEGLVLPPRPERGESEALQFTLMLK